MGHMQRVVLGVHIGIFVGLYGFTVEMNYATFTWYIILFFYLLDIMFLSGSVFVAIEWHGCIGVQVCECVYV